MKPILSIMFDKQSQMKILSDFFILAKYSDFAKNKNLYIDVFNNSENKLLKERKRDWRRVTDVDSSNNSVVYL